MPDDFPVSYAANLASLTTQVKALEGDYGKMELAVHNLDRKLEASFSSLSSRFEAALGSLNSKLDDQHRPQWSMYGVMVTIIIALATFFFWPINTQGQDNKAQIAENAKNLGQLLQALPDHYVNYREHERLVREIETSRQDITRQMVTRSEHEQQWHNIYSRMDRLQHEVDRLMPKSIQPQ